MMTTQIRYELTQKGLDVTDHVLSDMLAGMSLDDYCDWLNRNRDRYTLDDIANAHFFDGC